MKWLLTVGIIILFIIIWVFVFQATKNFDTSMGSDWLCMGCISLILSAVICPALLVYLHTKQ